MCLDHKEQPSLIGCTSGIPQRKKQTNADRIRSMSDEELAEQLIQYRDDWGDYCTHKGCYATQKEAVEAEIEWLKQQEE